MMVKGHGEHVGSKDMPFEAAQRPAPGASTDTRLSVVAAFLQVEEDAADIHRRLRSDFCMLTPDDVLQIQENGLKIMDEKERRYALYEIGHYFLLDQVMQRLTESIDLTGQEEGLLRAALGKLYYNVPELERIRQVQAAEDLEQLPRSQQIYDALRKEVGVVLDLVRQAHTDSGMFHTPVGIWRDILNRKKSFAELAEFLSTVKPEPFYK